MPRQTGVVGAGPAAQDEHIPALSRNPRTELSAICAPTRERTAVEGYDARVYDDVDDMLAAESLEWVHVATPVGTHLDIGMRVVDADVPLLLQQPATVSRTELDRLRSRADERGVPISVVHDRLYDPVIRDLRRRVRAGEIGPLRAVETTVSGERLSAESDRGDRETALPGGGVEDGMSHPVYLTLALGGTPTDESSIDARTALAGEYDHDVYYDAVSLQYESGTGTLCSLTFLAESTRGTTVTVFGRDGSVSVDVPATTVHWQDADAGPSHDWDERFRRNLALSRTVFRGFARNLRRTGREYVEDRFDVHLSKSPDGFYYLIDRAVKALDEGRQPPRHPDESYWTLTLLERARATASGEAVA